MFELKQMLLIAWPVLSVLLFCSIYGTAVAWERFTFYRSREKEIPGTVRRWASELDARFSAKTAQSLEAAERFLDTEVRQFQGTLEERLNVLATIASTAPYIGLLGTTVGIIRAFHSIAKNAGGGPAVVASGIAEALISTALGLFVAISAVVLYNYFSTRMHRLSEKVELEAERALQGFLKG